MKTLIISAPIGSGHVKAGQAVGAALQSIDKSDDIVYANVFHFFPAFIGNSILKTYLKILSYFPHAYGMAYGWGNSSKAALLGRQVISRLLANQMLRYINEIKPDAIVATHATPAGLVAELLRQKKLRIPCITVVTDFIVHRLWVYPEISYYCVASETVRQELSALGIPLDRSFASGIPVDASFAKEKSKEAIAHKLGLNPFLPTILVMGGGDGLLPLDKLILAIDKLDSEFQCIVVCGKNKEMVNRLSQLPEMKHPLHIYGFVDTVAELMSAADMLITKPGGMTSAEALCCSLPLVLYRPIPGQEEANAMRLIEQGCAKRADTLVELVAMVGALLKDKKQRLELSLTAHDAAKPDAAMNVAHIVRKLAIR